MMLTMNNNDFQQLEQRLQDVMKLTRGGRKGGGKQPHKLILLLAIADRIKLGVASHDKVPIDQELKNLFKEYWLRFHPDHEKEGDIAQPLTRLPSDGIWALANPELHKQDISFSRIKTDSPYGWLDEKWFWLFNDPEKREAFKQNIIDYFFLDRHRETPYIDPEDSPDPRQRAIAKKVIKGDPVEPGEVFQRDRAFRDLVLKYYDFTCCITGIRINAGKYHLLEAAHIKDFSLFGNNAIPNGLSLNPFLHKAFDKGLFTIDYDPEANSVEKQYILRVSKQFQESNEGMIRLHQLDREPLFKVPKRPELRPSQEHLAWHQENKFETFTE